MPTLKQWWICNTCLSRCNSESEAVGGYESFKNADPEVLRGRKCLQDFKLPYSTTKVSKNIDESKENTTKVDPFPTLKEFLS